MCSVIYITEHLTHAPSNSAAFAQKYEKSTFSGGEKGTIDRAYPQNNTASRFRVMFLSKKHHLLHWLDIHFKVLTSSKCNNRWRRKHLPMLVRMTEHRLEFPCHFPQSIEWWMVCYYKWTFFVYLLFFLNRCSFLLHISF